MGSTHVWRCAYCRHRNEHGLLRPRVIAALLLLADIDPAARQLDVVDPRYGRYPTPRARLSPRQPHIPGRIGTSAPRGSRRGAAPDRAGQPVYARATVAGLPVLIVGGDRPYPHPLGLAEHDPEPCAFGSRVTRIACPCEQPPPCLHGQALYAHVVSPAVVAPAPRHAVSAPAEPAWSVPPGRRAGPRRRD